MHVNTRMGRAHVRVHVCVCVCARAFDVLVRLDIACEWPVRLKSSSLTHCPLVQWRVAL